MQGKSVQFIKNQGKFIKKNIIKIFQILILEFRIKRMDILFFLEVFFHLINKKNPSNISLYLPYNFQQFPIYKFIRNSRVSK